MAGEVADLVGLVAAIEQRQLDLAAALDEVVKEVREAASGHRQALAALHRDLLGERRAAATQEVFGAVVPALDALDAMLAGLDPDDSRQVRMQVGAVASTLRNILQSLGYDAFQVEAGEAFAPERMEALGYADGAPGVVIATVRPGYANRGTVVRPAGVLVAGGPAPDSAANRGGQP
jgi:molecular chaperone GrpE (heat shock protein)